MGKPIETPVPVEGARLPVFTGLPSLHNSRFVAFLFAGLIALQAVGYLILGTGQSGRGFSELILCFHTLLALRCAWIAFRRARGAAALFWFLFGVNLLFLMVPTVLMTVSTILNITLVSSSTWRVLFCLYGAPHRDDVVPPRNGPARPPKIPDSSRPVSGRDCRRPGLHDLLLSALATNGDLGRLGAQPYDQ